MSYREQFGRRDAAVAYDEVQYGPGSYADLLWQIEQTQLRKVLVDLRSTHRRIDYLDFASPRPGLGGKLGLDATRKIGAETDRDWGEVLTMSPDVAARVDAIWDSLGLGSGARGE